MICEKGTNRSQFFRNEVDQYTWTDIGSSYLPSELVGAFLFAQLEATEKITAARRRAFAKYHDLLRPLEASGLIKIPAVGLEDYYNGHLFYILTRSLEERSKLIRYLKERNIFAVSHYVPLHSSPAGMKYGRSNGKMRVTDHVSRKLMSLPLYYGITDDDIQRVVDSLKQFYSGIA